MAVPDFALEPLIGFAMNRLGRGESAEAVLALMERSRTFGYMSDADRREALQYALSNQLAKALLQTTGLSQTMASLIGKIIPTAENVGVRVVATVEGPPGTLHEISLTVNVPPDWRAEDVIELARNQIESGQYKPHTGNQYPTQLVGDPYIVGVYEGGLTNANVSVARPA